MIENAILLQMGCEIPIEMQREIERRETHKFLSYRGVITSTYLFGISASMFAVEDFEKISQYRTEIQRLAYERGSRFGEAIPSQILEQAKDTFPEGAELSRQHVEIYHHLEATLLSD
jgi:hypothetical protein